MLEVVMHTADSMLLLLVGNFELLAKDGHKVPRIQLDLCIGGSIIIGDLISSIEFEKESHRVMQALLKIHDETVDETARRLNLTHVDIVGKIPEFLHLKGVEFWPQNLSDQSDKPSTELWRIRISSIDAFHIDDSYVSAHCH